MYLSCWFCGAGILQRRKLVWNNMATTISCHKFWAWTQINQTNKQFWILRNHSSSKLQNWVWAADFAVQEYYRGENWHGITWQQPSLVKNLELIIRSLIYWETHEHYKLSVKNWLLQIRATIIMHYVCSLPLFHYGLTFLFLSKTCEVFLT